MLRAIIFDMDGTIIDSEHIKAKAWEESLQSFGVKGGNYWYVRNIGKSRNDLCNQAITQFSLEIPVKLLDMKRTSVYSRLSKNMPVFARVVSFIKSVPKDKYKVALASSTEYKDIISRIMKMKLLPYFDVILSGKNHVRKNKPHPDIYLLAARKLHVKPNECVVIEDSRSGLLAAKSAGMKCVVIPNRFTKNQKFNESDLVLNHNERLSINLLKSLFR